MRRKHPNVEVRDQFGMTDERGHWTGKVETLPLNLGNPLRTRKPQVWAVWNDLFHEDVPTDFQKAAFLIMKLCPQHIFIILTKRPQEAHIFWWTWLSPDCDRNVWLGVTAENQEQANKRIPVLRSIPARVKCVSYEPALGPVNWMPYLDFLNLVICGAETGPGARPMNPQWARDTLAQCQAAGVPFFMKKMSDGQPIPDDLNVREFPGESR